MHVPHAGQSTRMESNVGRSPQKGSLQNKKVGMFAQSLKIKVFGQQFSFGRNRQGNLQIGADFRFYRRYKVGNVVFRVQFLQIHIQTVDFDVFQQINQPLEN